MANPVRFETIARAVGVGVEVVVQWSKEVGFPSAGSGVAVLEKVVEWRKSLAGPVSDPASEPTSGPVSAAVLAVGVPDVPSVPSDEIHWVTIRVPVKPSASPVVGGNPVPTFRINSHESYLSAAWGQLFHGCRDSHVQLASGEHVDRVSQTLKYLIGLIAREVDQLNKA